MIIPDDRKDVKVSLDEHLDLQGASSSNVQDPPPPFEDNALRQVPDVLNDLSPHIYVPPADTTGEEPPPDFELYEADYRQESDGTIVSHDPHLNEDGASCVSK